MPRGSQRTQIMTCNITANDKRNTISVTAGVSGMGRKYEKLSRISRSGIICLTAVLCTTVVVFLGTQLIARVVSLDPAKMAAIGTVDERFQSYNIEMVEVIGGRFWKPYASSATNSNKAQEPAQREAIYPGRHRPEPLSIPSTDRPFEFPIAKAGSGTGPGVRASQRNVG